MEIVLLNATNVVHLLKIFIDSKIMFLWLWFVHFSFQTKARQQNMLIIFENTKNIIFGLRRFLRMVTIYVCFNQTCFKDHIRTNSSNVIMHHPLKRIKKDWDWEHVFSIIFLTFPLYLVTN